MYLLVSRSVGRGSACTASTCVEYSSTAAVVLVSCSQNQLPRMTDRKRGTQDRNPQHAARGQGNAHVVGWMIALPHPKVQLQGAHAPPRLYLGTTSNGCTCRRQRRILLQHDLTIRCNKKCETGSARCPHRASSMRDVTSHGGDQWHSAKRRKQPGFHVRSWPR